MSSGQSSIPIAPATELPAKRTYTVRAALADEVTMALIESALRDPESFVQRQRNDVLNGPELEPMERWQTRAVMAALGKAFR